MKKTKRLTALFLSLTFILSTVLSAYATTVTSPSATTVTVEDATDDDGNTYTIVNITAGEEHLDEDQESEAYQEALEVGGYIYIEDIDEEPDITEDEEIVASVEEKVQELVETLAEEGVDLVNESGETVTAEDVVIAATVEINWYDLGIDYDEAKETVINWPIRVRFNVPGVTKYNFVGAMHKPTGGDWQFERAEFVSDGYVDVWLYSFSPVAFLVVSTEDTTETDTTTVASGTATTTVSGGTSSQTGDISLAVPVALLVVAGVAIVVLVVKGKKKETE